MSRFALTAALLMAFASIASAAGERPASLVRFHLEASLSRETDRLIEMDEAGWGGDIGVAIGRGFAALFDVGLERYPGAPPPTPLAGDRLRVGGGDWTVKTFGLGVRVSVPVGRVDVFGDATAGPVWAEGRFGSVLDRGTGATVIPDRASDWRGLVGDLGLGVRTRSAGRIDGYVAIRRRSYGEMFEGTSHGVALQFRLGILTR